jgi:hypothetical protein
VGNVDLSGERETPRGGGDRVRGRQRERVSVRVRAPFYTIVMQCSHRIANGWPGLVGPFGHNGQV